MCSLYRVINRYLALSIPQSPCSVPTVQSSTPTKMIVMLGTCSTLPWTKQIYSSWNLIKSLTSLLDESLHFLVPCPKFPVDPSNLERKINKQTKKHGNQSTGTELNLSKCIVVWPWEHSKKSAIPSASSHDPTMKVIPNSFFMTLKIWLKICQICKNVQFHFSCFGIGPKGIMEQLDEDQTRKKSPKQ